MLSDPIDRRMFAFAAVGIGCVLLLSSAIFWLGWQYGNQPQSLHATCAVAAVSEDHTQVTLHNCH